MRSVAVGFVFDAAKAKRRVKRAKSKDAGDRQGTTKDKKNESPSIRVQRTVHGVADVIHAQENDGHDQTDQAIEDTHVLFHAGATLE